MAQFFNVFVKITGQAFIPMGLPVDYVWEVNDVVARYVVNNGDAVYCDSAGVPIVPPWPPTIQGIIADGVTVTLDYDLDMLIDSQLGLTILVDEVEATISGVAATDSNVDITVSAAITAGQVVEVAYNSGAGNIRSDATAPADAASFNSTVASNVTT